MSTTTSTPIASFAVTASATLLNRSRQSLPMGVSSGMPPLNVTTFRERISGGANQGRARDATREEVHCGADHWEAPGG